jgi:hypothetical protein
MIKLLVASPKLSFTKIELVLYFVKALILVKCVALGFTYHIKEEKPCI